MTNDEILLDTLFKVSELRMDVESAERKIKLLIRSNKIELLDRYTTFLQRNGYIDTDATCEEPFAIDEFLKND